MRLVAGYLIMKGTGGEGREKAKARRKRSSMVKYFDAICMNRWSEDFVRCLIRVLDPIRLTGNDVPDLWPILSPHEASVIKLSGKERSQLGADESEASCVNWPVGRNDPDWRCRTFLKVGFVDGLLDTAEEQTAKGSSIVSSKDYWMD